MEIASDAVRPAAGRWSAATLGLTILISAFLLFQVQPLVSKAILPWFGGCTAVWTTSLLFFQALLFAGYVYAHLLQRWLAPRRQVVVHLVVIAAALTTLLPRDVQALADTNTRLLTIVPRPSWKPADVSNPTGQILLLLACTVGLPYFALSATSPLVQAWFSSANPGRSPYRLYALSNIGSLAALLSYPFLFEPVLALGQQSTLWSVAFVLYGALCTACLASLWHVSPQRVSSPATAGHEASQPSAAPPNWLDRCIWLALTACASLMLLAATNHICQDVAVVPFLWIVPLTLYLLSFIICFDHQRWYVRPVWAAAAVLALTAVAGNDYLKQSASPLSLSGELVLNSAALFFVCMVCHGELARRKPHPRHLTEFYLLIAAGGALGGLLVAIAAPLLFSTYFEWQIGVAASAILAAGLLIAPLLRGRRRLRYAVFTVLVVAAWGYLAFWEFQASRPLDRARNFFGVVSVMADRRGPQELREVYLKHGRIVHGRQFADPARRHWPTSYFGPQSGVAQAIRHFQDLGPARVGTIGLGVGTLAAYARAGDAFRYYEINPEVLRMAREHFTYLADCRGAVDVELGDGRLLLEAEPPQGFQVLVLDAFSGDAPPTHLLTREAFDLYRRHLAPGGVIAVDITNKYLDFAPVIRQAAEHCRMKTTRIHAARQSSRLLDDNQWMLLTENEDFLQAHPPTRKQWDDDDLVVPMWTDDYSNLFRILQGGIWRFRRP